MKRMAATGGLMLLLAGCYPAQQACDQNPTTYNGQSTAAAPRGTQPNWQRYDGAPAWPPAAAGTVTNSSKPLFNNSPLSPYSAPAQPTSLAGTVAGAAAASSTAGPAMGPAPAVTAPGTAPVQQMAAAVQGASPHPGPSGAMVAQADLKTAEVLPVLKATAKSGPARSTAEPAPLAPVPESTPLTRESSGSSTGHTEVKKDENAASSSAWPVRPVSWENPHTSAKLTTSRSAPAVRMVNNKRIQLNYKVEDTGPSGVGGVELWCTVDGRAWQKCTRVTKAGSSCVTEVNDEGIYGFTLVARSGNGNAKEPPKAGDMPQVWVEVDLTAPTVALTDIKMGTVQGASHLHICWNASDRNLARRPITISYAQTPAGPWTIIASNLDNTGQYDWTVPAALAAKILLKVEACDFVGNVGSAQTREAIALDTAKPTVSILDVESASK